MKPAIPAEYISTDEAWEKLRSVLPEGKALGARPPGETAAYAAWRKRLDALDARIGALLLAAVRDGTLPARALTQQGEHGTWAELRLPHDYWKAVNFYPSATGGEGTSAALPLLLGRVRDVQATIQGIGRTAAPLVFRNHEWQAWLNRTTALAKGKGGRPTAADRDALREAFRLRVKEIGMPERTNIDGWQTKADVERWILTHAEREGRTIGDTTARRYATIFMNGEQ